MTKIELISKYDKKPNSVYHLPLFDRWANMNRVCDPKGKAISSSACARKGIKVYKEWKRYKQNTFDYERINYQNYKNYVKFITRLIEKAKEFDEESNYKNIRIERKDKNKDFEPSNIHIIDMDSGLIFDPIPSELTYCLE